MTAAHVLVCPHCGGRIESAEGTRNARDPGEEPRAAPAALYDLEKMAAIAAREKAYDETVKVRVTQEQIRKLVDKRRKKPR